MAHEDRIGHGTKVYRTADGTSAGVRGHVGRIRDVTPPNLSRDAVESTDMESEEKWEEFIGGIKRSGELTFEMTFDPGSAEVIAFLAELNTDTAGYYILVFPDTTEWGFGALLTGYEPTTPVADKMSASVTFKLSGKPGFIA
jgi:predicted secreted protein